ncbi:hypothetical protein HGI47_10235 [Novosphingobium sp. ERN07]|uniref:hypothetical protein n=1 Tax=Novosphingobium sp. ERN07 TaxID=2726187 RepID=UPI00145631A6|nr:hypothetical protein [Novosphingobium sp. ERN07]NLR71252.1 hypothetical protein [Novosphingobium sp. ERN07]
MGETATDPALCPSPECRVSFSVPVHGWIYLHIRGLTRGGGKISCSEVRDPFPDFIRWLEAIIDRPRAASWVIGDEGSTNILTCVPHHSLGSEGDHLIVNRLDWEEHCVQEWSPAELVRDFYTAFVEMTERADYDPRAWEWSGDPRDYCGSLYESDDLDWHYRPGAFPYSGARLHLLRSRKIEAFITGSGTEQLTLAFDG